MENNLFTANSCLCSEFVQYKLHLIKCNEIVGGSP